MKELQTLFETPLASVFGQTLLHSLWQGMGIVLLYLLISKLVKSAKNKVWLGLGAFSLQTIVSIFTFWLLMPDMVTVENPATLTDTATLSFSSTLDSDSTLLWYDWLSQHSHLLFVGWCLGFTFLLLRQLSGLAYVYYLRGTGIREVSSKVSEVYKGLLQKIDSHLPAIEIKESYKVQTAMVLGHLKPLVLIPVSFAAGLSSSQLELILAHEIAHIKRNDFAINLLQGIMENLFFFHPAYWLVSNQISENREHACDDWAAELTGNRVLLAKTLAQIQLGQHQPVLAMAFGKRRMTMLNRIQRLLGVSPQQQKMKLTALLLMIATLGVFGFVNTQNEEEKVEQEEVTEVSKSVLTEINEVQNQVQMEMPVVDKVTIIDSGRVERRINYDMGESDIRIKTDVYDVRINENRILVNGKEQALSAAEKRKLKEHWDGIRQHSKEVKGISHDIEQEVNKIEVLHKNVMKEVDFDPSNDPEFQKFMKVIQEEGEKISVYAKEFQQKVEKLDKNSPDFEKKLKTLETDFESKVKVHEAKMASAEVNMKDFEERMENFEVKMEKDLEIPMRKIEIILEEKESRIDAAADKLEYHHDALIDMLPLEVREHLGTIDRPKPPKPPKPVKPIKPVKPEKLKNKVNPPQPAQPPVPPAAPTPIED